jgi:hypothetical protein
MVAFNDTSSEQGWSSALVVNWYQSTYHPVDPVRVFDSRNGTGLLGKLVAKTPRAIAVAGQLTLPSGISAITANVTVTGSTAGWAVYLGPSPNASPSSSMINFTAGQTVANGVTVALASTGKVYATYISNASNTTEIVIDVTGYFTANLTGETYTPIAPVRELDTRSNKGISGKLSPFAPQAFQVAGNDGIPLTAQAVTGIVTVANPSDGYAVFLGPTSIAHPTSSTINFGANQTISNNLTVKLGAGKIWATFLGSGTTDLVFDVTGYYVTSTAGSIYVPMEPVRLLDTRNGTGHSGKIVYGTPIEFAVGSNTGNGGIPMVSSAVTGNVTVVNQSFGWAVFLGPAKTMSPSTSTVNFVVDQVTANGCTVRLSPSASLWATFVSNGANTTDLVFDATGFFLP